jgi:tetratricopeptide (TPR) repeat protein
MLDRAAAEVNRALARGAGAAEGLSLLGDVFSRQRLHGEALERYRQARRVNGVVPRAIAGELRSLLILGRADEAQGVADALLAVEGTSAESLLLAARARSLAGDHVAAKALLGEARRLAPARADVLKELGDVARASGDTTGAVAAYRGALDLDQDFAVVRYELARLLGGRGDFAEAEAELVAALDAVPTYVEATLELAKVRRRSGRAREAVRPLAELLQGDPHNLEALLSLGESLYELERPRDAAVAIERVLRFDPQHVGALYLQGALLVDQHRYREAIERWNRVVELEPNSDYARRAQRDARTAADLLRIFRSRPEAGNGN